MLEKNGINTIKHITSFFDVIGDKIKYFSSTRHSLRKKKLQIIRRRLKAMQLNISIISTEWTET